MNKIVLDFKVSYDPSTSPKYSLNRTDLWKATRGLLITIAATVITYVGATYTQFTYGIQIGDRVIDLTPLAIPIIGWLIELSRRYLTRYSHV